jgi:hypothetical protein
MAWYVFALLDAPPARRMQGLSGPIAVREMGPCYVAAERRADVPPIELGALKRHHLVVARLWKAVPAVLPVRFGTLLESTDIGEALEEKDDELAEAFDRVRGRAQFSWRAPRTPRARSGACPRVDATPALLADPARPGAVHRSRTLRTVAGGAA